MWLLRDTGVVSFSVFRYAYGRVAQYSPHHRGTKSAIRAIERRLTRKEDHVSAGGVRVAGLDVGAAWIMHKCRRWTCRDLGRDHRGFLSGVIECGDTVVLPRGFGAQDMLTDDVAVPGPAGEIEYLLENGYERAEDEMSKLIPGTCQ